MKPEENDDRESEWPFPHIPHEVYWSLPKPDRDALEQIVRDLVDKTNSKH